MARQPKLPSPSEFSREWGRLERDDKRRIRRAVNRMQPAASRRDARLAVVFAQNQQRTAKWLLPISVLLVAALQLPQGLEAVLAMGAVGLVLFGFITFAISWRARRAERVNRAVLEGSQALGGERKDRDKERGKGRGRGGARSDADADDAADDDLAETDDEAAAHATGGGGGSSSGSGGGTRRRKRAHTDGRPRQGKRSSKRKRSKARSKR